MISRLTILAVLFWASNALIVLEFAGDPSVTARCDAAHLSFDDGSETAAFEIAPSADLPQAAHYFGRGETKIVPKSPPVGGRISERVWSRTSFRQRVLPAINRPAASLQKARLPLRI